MGSFDPRYCPDGDRHDWEQDPQRRGEGSICSWCGLTEAELDHSRDGASLIPGEDMVVAPDSPMGTGLDTWDF